MGNHWNTWWLTDTHPSSFFPFLPPLHPISQGFWRGTCEEQKADLPGKWRSLRFCNCKWTQRKSRVKNPRKPELEEEWRVVKFSWRNSWHQEEATCPKPHKHCLMLLLHKTDYTFHLFPRRHLWFSSKKFKMKGNKACVYIFAGNIVAPWVHLLFLPWGSQCLHCSPARIPHSLADHPQADPAAPCLYSAAPCVFTATANILPCCVTCSRASVPVGFTVPN